MKMSMLALALALVAPAAHSQTQTNVPAAVKTHARTHAKSRKHALSPSAEGQIKVLRAEVKRERADLSARSRAERASRKTLGEAERAELAKLKTAPGKRTEKTQARRALKAKYAALLQDGRRKSRSQAAFVREDIKSKRQMISKLRRS